MRVASPQPLSACGGLRLSPLALAVTMHTPDRAYNLAELTALPLEDMAGELERLKTPASLAAALKGQGFRLVATSFTETAVPLQKWDLTTKTAIILGNEHSGVDEDLAPHVDGALYIPMMGMVQSLNVSVAAAVILYEGFRQLEAAGRYDAPCIESEEMARLVKLWCSK